MAVSGIRSSCCVGVGVAVETVGVLVAVPWEVGVGVGVLVAVGVELVGEFVGVGEAMVGVGDGVVAEAIEIARRPLLFNMSGSASFPITPATTLSVPAILGETLIATLASPVAGHITVVAASSVAALAKHPPVEPPALNVTAGWKIAVTVTAGSPDRRGDSYGDSQRRPDRPRRGNEIAATERSYDWASTSAAPPATAATRTALRADRAPAMRPPFDASPAQVLSISVAQSGFLQPRQDDVFISFIATLHFFKDLKQMLSSCRQAVIRNSSLFSVNRLVGAVVSQATHPAEQDLSDVCQLVWCWFGMLSFQHVSHSVQDPPPGLSLSVRGACDRIRITCPVPDSGSRTSSASQRLQD